MELNMFADFTSAIPLEKRLGLISLNGFDGVMLGFSDEYKHTQYELADSFGLKTENVHSPFDRMNALWEKREDSDLILGRTAECIRICAANGVDKVVVHPTDGMVPPPVTAFGLGNFDRLISVAANCNVRLLFENIQLPQFLDVLFAKFSGSENVAFCYDVGHESCFTKADDRLTKHGARLEALHIHDNDGASDGHMIPFDGCIDFEPFLAKVRSLGYEGTLSMELYMTKSPLYKNTSPEEFVRRARQAAERLNDMYDRMR